MNLRVNTYIHTQMHTCRDAIRAFIYMLERSLEGKSFGGVTPTADSLLQSLRPFLLSEQNRYALVEMVRVYVCMYVFVYVFMYVCMCVCAASHLQLIHYYKVWYIPQYTYTNTDKHTLSHRYAYIYRYIYIYIHICMYVCMYVCMYDYIHIGGFGASRRASGCMQC